MFEFSLLERSLLFYGLQLPHHPRKWQLHSLLRQWMAIHPDREFDVVRNGLKWSLNPADFADEALFWLGTKDTWDVEHLKRQAKPDDVILDVGANFGYYGLILGRALEGRCLVHALEPDPRNFDRLCRHINKNDLRGVVQPHSVGVSNAEGGANLNRHPGNSGHSAITPEGEIHGVKLTTLDRLSKELALERVNIIVLDVEGLEAPALEGAAQTLSRFRPLVCVEFFPPVMARQGSSPEAAAQVLANQGYELFFAYRNRLQPLTSLPTGDSRVNVFAFHKDKLPDLSHSCRKPVKHG